MTADHQPRAAEKTHKAGNDNPEAKRNSHSAAREQQKAKRPPTAMPSSHPNGDCRDAYNGQSHG